MINKKNENEKDKQSFLGILACSFPDNP